MSEISLSTPAGEPCFRASILDISEGGVFVAFVPPDAEVRVGQRLEFQFVVPTGEVTGSAEVVRVSPSDRELALRILKVHGEEGLPNLLAFLQAWFCNV